MPKLRLGSPRWNTEITASFGQPHLLGNLARARARLRARRRPAPRHEFVYTHLATHGFSLWLRHLKQTALTRGFTGRLARGLKNRLLDEFNQKDIEILPYPLQRALVRHLSIPAEKAGKSELLPLWGAKRQLIAQHECAGATRHIRGGDF